MSDINISIIDREGETHQNRGAHRYGDEFDGSL